MQKILLNEKISERFDFAGMKFLGKGIEAHVYTDGFYAYKRVSANSRYIKWLEYLQETKVYRSRHVPKVYAIYKFRDEYDCVVKMELLQPLRGDEINTCYGWYNKIMKLGQSRATTYTGMNRVLQNIGKFVEKHGANLDIHHGNVMKRGERLVITDPVT